MHFDDGTILNAYAVEWNIDRWIYLTNSSGQLSSTDVPATPSSLYYFINGTPIIKDADIIGDYEIMIKLNALFGPFIPFLAFEANSIISPTAHSQIEFIDLTS